MLNKCLQKKSHHDSKNQNIKILLKCNHFTFRDIATGLKVPAVDVWTMKLANKLINYFLKSDNVGRENLGCLLKRDGNGIKIAKNGN